MVDNDNRYFVSTNFTTQYDQHAHRYNSHSVRTHTAHTHTLENDVIMPSTSSSSSFLYHDFRCRCHCWCRYTATATVFVVVDVVVVFVISVICSYPLCSRRSPPPPLPFFSRTVVYSYRFDVALTTFF